MSEEREFATLEELIERPSSVREVIKHYENRIVEMRRMTPPIIDLPDAGLRLDRNLLINTLVKIARVEFSDPDPKPEPMFRFNFDTGDWEVKLE